MKPFTGIFNNLILLNSDTENGQRLGGTNIKRAKQCYVKKILSLFCIMWEDIQGFEIFRVVEYLSFSTFHFQNIDTG